MCRWLPRLVVAVLVCIVCCTVAMAQTSGDGSGGAGTVRPAQASTASADEVDDDMHKILLKVGSIPCSERIRSHMYMLLFANNRALHDQCYNDCGYQFFPVSQAKAKPEQIRAAATSKACVTLFSGVILANFPECDVAFMSIRSCAEILLRIKKDIEEKDAVPTQAQFYQFYNLNRVINLLNENASLIEDAFRTTPTRISVWELTKMMNHIYVNPDVDLAANMTILVRNSTTTDRSGWTEANVALSLTDSHDTGLQLPSDMPTTVPTDTSPSTASDPTFGPTSTPSVVKEILESSRAAPLSVASRGVVVAVVIMFFLNR